MCRVRSSSSSPMELPVFQQSLYDKWEPPSFREQRGQPRMCSALSFAAADRYQQGGCVLDHESGHLRDRPGLLQCDWSRPVSVHRGRACLAPTIIQRGLAPRRGHLLDDAMISLFSVCELGCVVPESLFPQLHCSLCCRIDGHADDSRESSRRL